ncbi:FtsX-like permease family protein [Pedobacter sp. HMF7647]|uniref:FtsX-like permease family protein n=1 Tax=Hufsiella arboris TaxID=2695275 RepID=A0A7K1YA53_9SPHI|nr:ABC transporter permease [Hufsiella arboris]MXV51466.1 FtsX-like permease family protein [Hufsiella arboris]
MLKNYFKIAWRNLIKNKIYSAINIVGLSIGMAVALLIGFWIWDELSFNKSFRNYDSIVQVMHNWNDDSFNRISTEFVMPIPAATELRTKYASNFKHIALARYTNKQILAYQDKKVSRNAFTAEPEITEILSLKMIAGSRAGLNDPSSILISQSLAKTLFGDTDPMNKMVRMNNKSVMKINGVYEDFPHNTNFYGSDFIIPWAYTVADRPWIKEAYSQWNNNSFVIYAQLADNKTAAEVSQRVRNLLQGKPDRNDDPKVFLHPMKSWHLYNDFKDGKNSGGTIQFVWMFGIIGVFVLLLACINFMNLSTARSQKRAREVGVRKAVGSRRKELIIQFLCESVLITCISLVLSIILVQLAIPLFNELSAKQINIPWTNGIFWILACSFTLFTGLLAGSYPAFYLSSFNPLKVLKGTFKAGKFASMPRKVLVVIQFTVSITLVIGTVIIFQQIQHAKNRPIGFNKNGLITVFMKTPDLYGKYDLLRNELINTGAAVNMAEASNPATDVNAHLIGFDWKGKNPKLEPSFSVSWVTHDFGNTVGWKFTSGRDFSRRFATDSVGMVLNEAAVKFMGLKNAVGETVKFGDTNFRVIGVIQNPIMESPFAQPVPTVFMMNYENVGVITIKANPAISMQAALEKIQPVFKKYSPSTPFEYSFVDDDFAAKFASEQRIGSLATFFAVFAVFISCLGIFGLASFLAEQRTKEIGVRKVLGASITNLWQLLSKEFLLLVSASYLIAIPAAWYFMNKWLQGYEYRMEISIWIFVITAAALLAITLATVSFQAIRAALTNPVKSLRTE